MGKASVLFPFRGEMVSAGDIAAAYGIDRKYAQNIKVRLLAGMGVDEAVADAWNGRITPPDMTGIRPWEIDRLRKRLKRGDKLRVRVTSSNKADTEPTIRWETCRVTGTYPYVVTFRRPCGLGVSKTYVELIQDGIR